MSSNCDKMDYASKCEMYTYKFIFKLRNRTHKCELKALNFLHESLHSFHCCLSFLLTAMFLMFRVLKRSKHCNWGTKSDMVKRYWNGAAFDDCNVKCESLIDAHECEIPTPIPSANERRARTANYSHVFEDSDEDLSGLNLHRHPQTCPAGHHLESAQSSALFNFFNDPAGISLCLNTTEVQMLSKALGDCLEKGSSRDTSQLHSEKLESTTNPQNESLSENQSADIAHLQSSTANANQNTATSEFPNVDFNGAQDIRPAYQSSTINLRAREAPHADIPRPVTHTEHTDAETIKPSRIDTNISDLVSDISRAASSNNQSLEVGTAKVVKLSGPTCSTPMEMSNADHLVDLNIADNSAADPDSKRHRFSQAMLHCKSKSNEFLRSKFKHQDKSNAGPTSGNEGATDYEPLVSSTPLKPTGHAEERKLSATNGDLETSSLFFGYQSPVVESNIDIDIDQTASYHPSSSVSKDSFAADFQPLKDTLEVNPETTNDGDAETDGDSSRKGLFRRRSHKKHRLNPFKKTTTTTPEPSLLSDDQVSEKTSEAQAEESSKPE